MANLTELNQWEAGIYQLETTDPVEGGPNGIDNLQAKQLGNRTAYLKEQVEALGLGKQPLDDTLTALAALATVADRLIYSTGQDTFALTPLTAFIRTLLAATDAAAARALLGAISQAQLDIAIANLVNSSPAALDTLNELAAALGNDANFAATITAALALKVNTSDLPAPTLFASSSEAQALSSTDKAISPATLAAAHQGANQSLSANGYQRLPGGLIIQWRQLTSSATAFGITFPVAFPNSCFSVAGNVSGVGSSSADAVEFQNQTTSGCDVIVVSSSSGAVSAPVRLIAIGF